jgi:hypothetical protein
MATQDVSVRRTFQQPEISGRRQRCSVDPVTLAAIGRAVGQQVRIVRRDAPEFALFTVAQVRPQDPPGTVCMGQAGRERLGRSDEFDAVIDPLGPDPTRSDAEAEAAGELVERLSGGGRSLIALARHGGDIELFTDDQAERVRDVLAAEGASSWLCRGWRPGGGALVRWHVTSADLAPECFPELHTLVGRAFADAVAFHGHTGTEVLVGGAAPWALRRRSSRPSGSRRPAPTSPSASRRPTTGSAATTRATSSTASRRAGPTASRSSSPSRPAATTAS